MKKTTAKSKSKLNCIFDIDVTLNGGYIYTTNAKISSNLANQRQTQTIIDLLGNHNIVVLDIGCGDGTYTYELLKKCRPKKIIGFDVSKKAIDVAKKNYKKENIIFYYDNIFSFSKRKEKADLAIVRGVLHHLGNAKLAIKAISQYADEVIIIEPNGQNPILKIIEKLSPYHRVHREKSYFPFQINNWLDLAGYKIEQYKYINLVPFFCPDKIAIILKKIEPFAESSPIRSLICGSYVIHAKKENYNEK